MIMFAESSVEVVRLIFGRTIGLEVFPYRFAFPAFLICLMIRGVTVEVMGSRGGA